MGLVVLGADVDFSAIYWRIDEDEEESFPLESVRNEPVIRGNGGAEVRFGEVLKGVLLGDVFNPMYFAFADAN